MIDPKSQGVQCWICPQCYDDWNHQPGDAHCLRQQNDRLKAELTAARDEAERLRGRVSEMEAVIPDHIIRAHQRAEVCWDAFNHLDSAMKSPMVQHFVLRKQAEAVVPAMMVTAREFGRADITYSAMRMFAEDYAQRLRQQADELEHPDGRP